MKRNVTWETQLRAPSRPSGQALPPRLVRRRGAELLLRQEPVSAAWSPQHPPDCDPGADPVVPERLETAVLQITYERRHHRPGDEERDHQADRDLRSTNRREEIVTPLIKLVERRRAECRQGKQKGELRGGGRRKPGQLTGDDGAHGARRAGPHG